MTFQVLTAVLLNVPFFWDVTLSVGHTPEELPLQRLQCLKRLTT
jgi:hypothetical protein